MNETSDLVLTAKLEVPIAATPLIASPVGLICCGLLTCPVAALDKTSAPLSNPRHSPWVKGFGPTHVTSGLSVEPCTAARMRSLGFISNPLFSDAFAGQGLCRRFEPFDQTPQGQADIFALGTSAEPVGRLAKLDTRASWYRPAQQETLPSAGPRFLFRVDAGFHPPEPRSHKGFPLHRPLVDCLRVLRSRPHPPGQRSRTLRQA